MTSAPEEPASGDATSPGAAEEVIPPLRPLDEHNAALQAAVHPPDWVNPTPDGRYNLVVIGAGTAGLVTAAGAAGLGAKVALVERELMGGDCLNVGCVPSKALIRCARALAEARDSATYGIHGIESPSVDFPAVMERMRRLRAGIAPHDSAERFRELGIDVFLGQASFARDGVVQVRGEHHHDRELPYARAVIATGARAAEPDITGLKEAGYLTNETVFSLTELPRRLAVIGAGPIGCELAQSFARFGSRVTLIESGSRILPREDEEASRIVAESLIRDGVEIVFNATASEVTASESGKRITVNQEGESREITCDEILVGIGRAPNVRGLNLKAVGIEYDERGGVAVDDRLRTTNRRVYAAGDVCSRFKFTHAADAMARIAIQNALFFGRAKASALTIPWCTFTDPEVAQVGKSARELEKAGIAFDTIRINMDQVDRAILDGEGRGFLKIHHRRGSDKILGATLVARHAGEMISEISLAVTSGLGLRDFAATIHPYPTQAEAIKKAGDAFNRTRLTPRVTKVFNWLMARRR